MDIENIWDDDIEILEACEIFTATIKAEKKVDKTKKVDKPKRKYVFKDGNMSFASQVKDYQERFRISTEREISYSQAKIKVQQMKASEKRRMDKIEQNRRNYTKIKPALQDIPSEDPYKDFDSDSETVALDS
jgi:hypothetical protein